MLQGLTLTALTVSLLDRKTLSKRLLCPGLQTLSLQNHLPFHTPVTVHEPSLLSAGSFFSLDAPAERASLPKPFLTSGSVVPLRSTASSSGSSPAPPSPWCEGWGWCQPSSEPNTYTHQHLPTGYLQSIPPPGSLVPRDLSPLPSQQPLRGTRAPE